MRSVQARSLVLLLALALLAPMSFPQLGWAPEPGLSARADPLLPPPLPRSVRIVGEFKGYVSGNFTGFRDVDYSKAPSWVARGPPWTHERYLIEENLTAEFSGFVNGTLSGDVEVVKRERTPRGEVKIIWVEGTFEGFIEGRTLPWVRVRGKFRGRIYGELRLVEAVTRASGLRIRVWTNKQFYECGEDVIIYVYVNKPCTILLVVKGPYTYSLLKDLTTPGVHVVMSGYAGSLRGERRVYVEAYTDSERASDFTVYYVGG